MCEACPAMFRRWVKIWYGEDNTGKPQRRTHEEIVLEKEKKQKAVQARKEFHRRKKNNS